LRYASFISALLHVGLLAAGFIIAPFLPTPEIEYRAVVPIDLISEAEFADAVSVRADRKSEEVSEEPPAPLRDDIEVAELPEPIPVPQPLEEMPEPRLEPEPEPKKPEPKPEEKKPEPPKEQPKDKPKEEDDFFSGFDDALVDLEEEERSAPAEVLDPEGLRDQERIGLGDQLTASEIDVVRTRMAEYCYDQPTGVPNAEKLQVRVRFNLDRNGELLGQPKVLNNAQIAVSGNQWWKTTRDRAVQAVVACAPYDYLPEDRYHVWSEMTLNFTPQGVM
jgi:hypothetical protein